MSPLRTLVALVALSCAGFAKSPVTHETMWLMKRVGAPVPSPDGKWVVFSVTEPAYDEKEQVSDLWIVPADGSAPPRRLTFSKSGETGVAWSLDSSRVAFSAKRDGDENGQIYVLDIALGGEAVRYTSAATGASSPKWSPDGKLLLYASNFDPSSADRKNRKYKARVYETFPIRAWDHWLDGSVPHVFVQPAEPGAKARDLLAGTKLAAEPGFGGAGTASGGEDLQAVWAPDGQAVVFVATTNKHTAAYAFPSTHLYRVPLAGGEPQALTSGSDSYSRPVFRPDGRALYFIRSREGEKTYNLDRLGLLPWPEAGGARILTGEFDRSVGSFACTPDSRTLYLLAEDAGLEKLFTLPAEGGPVKQAIETATGVYTGLTVPDRASAPVLLANWESAVNAPEVVRIDVASGRHVPLTSFNAEQAAAIDWQPLKHFWFTSKRGKKIHSMLALPPNFDERKKYPLFVLLHGGPHSMWRDQFVLRWNYHLLAAPGYVVLLTNYTGSTGYGERFSQDIQGDPFIGPSAEINEAADEATRRFPFIDRARQAAGGASYGGHLANWLEATTTRYKCLISHAGLINLESQWGTSDTIYSREVNNGGPVWDQAKTWREQNPIRFAKNFRTPMLLTVGERDYRVPLNQTLENWSVLQRLRIPSKLIVFEDANHWILKGEDSRFFYGEVQAWLRKYLGNE